jgi:mRNA interferase MazF
MNFAQWSVWLASLDPTVGSEQGRTRPVLVISEGSLNEILPVVNVLLISSRIPNRRIYPNEAVLPARTGGLTLDSIVLCYQIRTLDKRRLTEMFGVIDGEELRQSILDALRFQLWNGSKTKVYGPARA